MLLQHRIHTSRIEFVGHSASACMFRVPGDHSHKGFFSMDPLEVRRNWIPVQTVERRKKAVRTTP